MMLEEQYPKQTPKNLQQGKFETYMIANCNVKGRESLRNTKAFLSHTKGNEGDHKAKERG